ncbi:MAG TPA: hypothetical protein VFQ43_12550 [Nitrososphaera sp.]|nr:hypothetical protein [Nitrososphaera sp.]
MSQQDVPLWRIERQNPLSVLALLCEVIVRKEVCDRLISECEQSFQKMGLDFYEVMKRAPEVVERWKKYYPLAQKVWSNSRSREQLSASRLPDLNPIPRNWNDGLLLSGSFHTSCAAHCRGLRRVYRRLPAVVRGS